MHIMKVNVVYTSLATGAVVCTTLTHFGAITVKIKASSGTVIVLAKERSKEQGLVVSVHAQLLFFFLLGSNDEEEAQRLSPVHTATRDRESQTI